MPCIEPAIYHFKDVASSNLGVLHLYLRPSGVKQELFDVVVTGTLHYYAKRPAYLYVENIFHRRKINS